MVARVIEECANRLQAAADQVGHPDYSLAEFRQHVYHAVIQLRALLAMPASEKQAITAETVAEIRDQCEQGLLAEHDCPAVYALAAIYADLGGPPPAPNAAPQEAKAGRASAITTDAPAVAAPDTTDKRGHTPRTDSEIVTWNGDWVPVAFARQLEREIAELHAAIKASCDDDRAEILSRGHGGCPLLATANSATKEVTVHGYSFPASMVNPQDAVRWQWLFGNNGDNIKVSVKLRQKPDGDMHDSATLKTGVLNLWPGVFPTDYWRRLIDLLMSGVELHEASKRALDR